MGEFPQIWGTRLWSGGMGETLVKNNKDGGILLEIILKQIFFNFNNFELHVDVYVHSNVDVMMQNRKYLLNVEQEAIQQSSNEYRRLTECSKSCDLQPALDCAIRGAQGVLPCVGWGVRPVNWIYRL